MKSPVKRSAFFLFLGMFALAACRPTVTETAPAATPMQEIAADTATPGPSPTLEPAVPVEDRVEDLLARMTLEEKIGQMTQTSVDALAAGDVKRLFLGSVLNGGGGLPDPNTLSGWIALVERYQREALDTRLGIPILYGMDAIHGWGLLHGATLFPQNVGLGATDDPDLVRAVGAATADELLAAGINWNFGPVVAVPQDIRWGRTYEGFGEQTELVSRLGAAKIEGLQSLPEGYKAAPGQTIRVLATAKHYLGDGGTVWGTSTRSIWDVPFMLDQGDMRVDDGTMRALFLPAYRAAVDAGVMSVMISFSSWNGVKNHANAYLITDVLKGELGFQGFVVSDWDGIEQLHPDNYYQSVVDAINAGIDMGMISSRYKEYLDVLERAVGNGDIAGERIDDAVRRILRVKFLLGLFDHPFADPALESSVRSNAHKEVAAQAVRESLVLLKNEGAALPIAEGIAAILVAGENSTGKQAGGWTLGWQGVNYNEVLGTTLFDGIRNRAGAGTEVLYDREGEFDQFEGKAPIGIVIVAEDSYAEGIGDRADLRLTGKEDELIRRMRAKAEKLIVIIISGRPLVITPQYGLADAWVAAWLPGSEGAAAADVLFGDYPFTGKTPYTWPRSNGQLPINVNNAAGLTGCQAPLFPFGYGLGEAGSAPIEWLAC